MYDELIGRLHRYTENCVAYKLDADFASAVQEAADAIEELQSKNSELLNDFENYSEYCKAKIEELSEQLVEETEYATALNSYVPQWIPVTERLPEEEKTVLTWGKEHQCILLDWMHDNKWCCFGGADYWMPLPEPPEKESES